jgi:hypothetical protein
MLDILRDYLVEATSPENVDAIEKAHEAFDRIGLQDYNPGFEQLLMINDEADQGDTLGGIIDLTKSLANGILKQHSITVSDEATVSILTEFIDALVELQQASDHIPEILKICAQKHDPEELFSELVALVGSQEAEHYLVDLVYVSDALITRIEELARAQEFGTHNEEDSEREFRETRITRFNRFMHFLTDPELAISKIAHMGIDAGYPYVVYANMIGREFEELDAESAAQNMLGMAFYSGDGFGNPQGVIKTEMDNLVSDVNKITQIDIAVSDLLVRFQAYESRLDTTA